MIRSSAYRTSERGDLAEDVGPCQRDAEVRFVHDVIFFYSRSEEFIGTTVRAYDSQYIETFFDQWRVGNRYFRRDLTVQCHTHPRTNLHMEGITPPSLLAKTREIWIGLSQGRIHCPRKREACPSEALHETCGCADPGHLADIKTMQPIAERLAIQPKSPRPSSNASSRPAVIRRRVLDPFCGCGTAIAVARNSHAVGLALTSHISPSPSAARLQDSSGAAQHLRNHRCATDVQGAEALKKSARTSSSGGRWTW